MNGPKSYVLDMFPYPSGEGLHVGHPKGYIATDVYSRHKRMCGYSVLHPMGWDAFGLPAENYAIKNKVHPRKAVEENVARFKSQLQKIGFNYDWDREVNTTDPEFYRWTQWIFLQLFKKRLAFESNESINWCPSCKTGLANEDLEGGLCERCGSEVEQKPMRQWVLRITDYADRLLDDLELLPKWPHHIKESQRNWIGKSTGSQISFKIKNSNEVIEIFTTRPDTLFGATYMVLAPEHPLVKVLWERIENTDQVQTYIEETSKKTEIDRTNDTKEKTGVQLEGVFALNPANNEELPIFVADYVLAHYGTGAIMAVPAHDERDYAFATAFNIPITQVFIPCTDDPTNPPQKGLKEVERETVIVFLKDSSNGKYALLNWHGTLEGITTGIMGGVENGQTPEEALLNEIREEAGLKNVTITKKLPWVTAARYCASHKGENRCAIAHAYLAEVPSLEGQISVDTEETEKHTLVWKEADEVYDSLVPIHQKELWEQFQKTSAILGEGTLMNSGSFDGTHTSEARATITAHVNGKQKNTYKLRDWVFSRQRYWGEPIPIIHCEKCGPVAVPDDQLPVVLPEVESYEPTGTGESPLADITEWVNTSCPTCDGPGKRETNTMPQWAGSSWYYLRFMDPHNAEALIDSLVEKQWSPVDVYVGGAEHATRHLIYARFWHKFLYDQGVLTTKEPFMELHSVGLIQAEDGRKMSKRWGNVINPDDIVEKFGADALRVYEMFMGPFDAAIAWSTDGLVGARRFLERTWRLHENLIESEHESVKTALHRTVKKVGEDISAFKFNTALAQMMTFVNLASTHGMTKDQYMTFLKLLAPFAPHLTEELWHIVGTQEHSIHVAKWPSYDETLLIDSEVSIAVQINGKMRGNITLEKDATENEAYERALTDESLKKWLGAEPKRIIFVTNKLINVVL